METLKVRDARDVEQAVRDAIAAEQPLEIIGHGSKRSLGQTMTTNAVLDVSALNAVVSYEPNELIVTVQAGAPLADVQSLIDAKNQQFGFEPMNISALLGGSSTAGTVGGMIGAGLAGPRRIKAGGVRDHLLGAHAVSGFGDGFVTGGKVVKNVTGYDLCKLLAGSWGTLAVMTEVTLKVMPKPEGETTLVLKGLDDLQAVRAMNKALGSSFDVSAAAHLPLSAMENAGTALENLGSARQSLTLLRLEGIAASVADRLQSLAAELSEFGAADDVSESRSREAWAALRDVTPFAASGPLSDWTVWRIVSPPAAGGELGQALTKQSDARVIYDWGGGLVWAAVPQTADGKAADLRTRVEAFGGHATLIRASEETRRSLGVFPPLQPGLEALNRRVKSSFDPRDILNRGRMLRSLA